jgi:hypothetical protein
MRRIFKTAVFILLAAIFTLNISAQFHSIMPEKPINKGIQGTEEDHSDTVYEREKRQLFPEGDGVKIDMEKDIPVFVSVRDSLVFGLLSKRLSVCLPLDFMRMTSSYGQRLDPISRCPSFHDGIDLRCDRARVYAMLPGMVKEVRLGKHGYGNYVVLNHGNMECLYGHLEAVTVRKGDFVYAGTIVGISGNTGKSTGPHLHIRLRKNGKSIDPSVFMACLDDYIKDIQESLVMAQERNNIKEKLTISNLAKALEKYGVHHPKIVIAQALLETGYFTSRLCVENNNLFGLRRPSDGSYYKFDNWEESVRAYRDYVQYRYKSGDYYAFLKKIGYATDAVYLRKIMQIVRSQI